MGTITKTAVGNHWQTDQEAMASNAWSAETTSWLRETGSITARLKQHWPNLTVRVLDEGLRTPQTDERLRLGQPSHATCWVREVVLQAAAHRLIHARTVVPAWTPDNPWHVLSTLGQRPLGELLFNLPDLERLPLEFAVASKASAPSRRRVYVWSGAPLLLTETFMLLACVEPTTHAAGA